MTLPVGLLIKPNDTYTDTCNIKDTQVRCAVCPDTHAPEPVWTAANVRARHLTEVRHTVDRQPCSSGWCSAAKSAAASSAHKSSVSCCSIQQAAGMQRANMARTICWCISREFVMHEAQRLMVNVRQLCCCHPRCFAMGHRRFQVLAHGHSWGYLLRRKLLAHRRRWNTLAICESWLKPQVSPLP